MLSRIVKVNRWSVYRYFLSVFLLIRSQDTKQGDKFDQICIYRFNAYLFWFISILLGIFLTLNIFYIRGWWNVINEIYKYLIMICFKNFHRVNLIISLQS